MYKYNSICLVICLAVDCISQYWILWRLECRAIDTAFIILNVTRSFLLICLYTIYKHSWYHHDNCLMILIDVVWWRLSVETDDYKNRYFKNTRHMICVFYSSDDKRLFVYVLHLSDILTIDISSFYCWAPVSSNECMPTSLTKLRVRTLAVLLLRQAGGLKTT